MKQHHKEFSELLKRFMSCKILNNTFAEHIYRKFEYLPGHELELNHNTIVLRFLVESDFNNFHNSAHGGALSTVLDTATTLALLKLNQAKTVSVEMNMSFLRPAKIGENILIRAEAQKFGRTLCYSQGDIFDEQKQLLFTGRHIKSVVKGSFLD